ncbi:unnamed protein product [Auanema sp. JU1783]|nr:unnamed protein product [Auanema sp. JU1783]
MTWHLINSNFSYFQGPALLWDPHAIRLYLKILQEASNWETLEAAAGAIQNLAACQFTPSVNVRSTVRVEKGLPVLVELIRLKEDYVVCAVATAMRNLALDARNRELIGKYALRDLVNKLPEPSKPRPQISDQTIGAILGILFEIVKDSAEYTKNLHEIKGTLKLRHLARSYPTYSQRICRHASQVLYIMWQHKELHDGFKRSGMKEADFYAGPARRGDSSTLARPISSQGRERPAQALLDETTSSGGYGALNETTQHSRAIPPQRFDHYQMSDDRSPVQRTEPLYASVRKGNASTTVDDSWV